MVEAEEMGTGRRVRRWRSVAEKRRIIDLTLEPGASVALVARAHGVNANQVFAWRRAFKSGELADPAAPATALLPVTVSAPYEAEIREPAAGQQSTGYDSLSDDIALAMAVMNKVLNAVQSFSLSRLFLYQSSNFL
jgi:transposase-like protein